MAPRQLSRRAVLAEPVSHGLKSRRLGVEIKSAHVRRELEAAKMELGGPEASLAWRSVKNVQLLVNHYVDVYLLV